MLKTIPARIVFWQLVVGAMGAAVSAVLLGSKAALGAFIGGAIAALLSLYFAIKALGWTRDRRGSDPQAMLRAFYRGEALKLVMATGLFVLVAIFLADVWLPLITTFVASQAVYGFALIWKSGDGY